MDGQSAAATGGRCGGGGGARDRSGRGRVAGKGRVLLRRAGRHSPELREALQLWKETRFEFEDADHLDPQGPGS